MPWKRRAGHMAKTHLRNSLLAQMTNRFAPPEAEVKDHVPSYPTTWPRTTGAVALFSLISLALAWFVAPLLAAALMQVAGHAGPSIPTEFLVLDSGLLCWLPFRGTPGKWSCRHRRCCSGCGRNDGLLCANWRR